MAVHRRGRRRLDGSAAAGVIDYLREENRILREKVGGKRLLLNAEQKRRLAVKGKALGRRLLEQFGTLSPPDAILRWHRWLIARKYDGSGHRGKPGPAPTKANMIRDLVVRMADENPGWGYGRIHGELKGLGYDVSWQTVRRVMLEEGLLRDLFGPKRVQFLQMVPYGQKHVQYAVEQQYIALDHGDHTPISVAAPVVKLVRQLLLARMTFSAGTGFVGLERAVSCGRIGVCVSKRKGGLTKSSAVLAVALASAAAGVGSISLLPGRAGRAQGRE